MSAKDDHAGALREAQLLDSLDHPNIIRYRESFVDKDGSLCIVTSFCEEGDLFNRIRKKAAAKEYFTEDEVMNMFVQIASAISYIHSKRVLHRDLKTQNIFIAKGGIIKLGDFGISKVLERTDSFATTVTGTPYYMAPEICTNQPYTYKSDIWSLGCVLYELCTLRHAFAADSLLSLVYQIVRGNFPPIPTDQFSNGLSDLVNRLLWRDPATRPSLSEVFKLPYVQKHLDRFKGEEQRRNLKQSTSMSRRKQLLDAQPAMGGYSENDANLTPKQKLERKKQMDRERRELEMRVAAMSANKNRAQVAARKQEMIYGSNIGLPGAQPQHAQAHQERGFEDDDMPNLGSVRIDDGPRAAAPPTRPGNRSIWDVDVPEPGPSVNPYAATLPSQARQQQAAAAARPQTSQQGARASPAGSAGRPGATALQQRPATTVAGSRGTPGAYGGGMWDDSDDVLQGSVRGTQRTVRTGLQGTASAVDASGGNNNGWTYGRNDDMPNMGTVQLTQGPGSSAFRGSPARPLEYTAGNRTNASDSPLMGSVVLGNSRTLGGIGTGAGAGAAASSGRPGSRGGPGGSILSAAPERPASPYTGGASPYGHAGQSPAAARPAAAAQYGAVAGGRAGGGYGAAGYGGSSQHGSHGRHGSHGHEDEDGYSDDFEEDDDDEGVVQQRNRIIANVEDMANRGYDGRDGIAAVQERVLNTGAKHDKVRMLRAKAERELGPKFGAVYDYLSRVRSQNPAPEEREVQRRLLEIVGDKSKMNGTFQVDQLVFTEQMYRDS
ncbi:hypothetical protein HYH02_006249 [Chlamydomonas schloesseri]|uniref:non-specific serine/threonine protein kinase n=1 Tax=Chlamydomonas schloesseri TaxID=2026947 RepID=A0A835WK53_9CHLO|nr:hypothetical protein HYH02_006249 [Chlamydomonas schloesseri]|eukprot:KAG2448901.1 hypothetical protein HYH02_006249 [Chlamydomonas schloesseri]